MDILTPKQIALAERASREAGRALNVIRAYRDEERRQGTPFNEANAIALDRLLESLDPAVVEPAE